MMMEKCVENSMQYTTFTYLQEWHWYTLTATEAHGRLPVRWAKMKAEQLAPNDFIELTRCEPPHVEQK